MAYIFTSPQPLLLRVDGCCTLYCKCRLKPNAEPNFSHTKTVEKFRVLSENHSNKQQRRELLDALQYKHLVLLLQLLKAQVQVEPDCPPFSPVVQQSVRKQCSPCHNSRGDRHTGRRGAVVLGRVLSNN